VRLTATNSAGSNTATKEDYITVCAVPLATTNAATSLGTTTATLNGMVNAHNSSTTVTFEYGTTISYGSTITATQSPVSGSSNTSVSAGITGLTPNTIYHYRV
jgi:PKD repeat protein